MTNHPALFKMHHPNPRDPRLWGFLLHKESVN
nr:MAG TPA: hypothetical protein [Caudoviricetes sp.]